jgi:hypothetical protein
LFIDFKGKEFMMRRLILGLALGLLMILCMLQESYADRRSYVWTYEYQTLPQGMSEIEYYGTIKVPDTNDPGIKTFEHWLEYEYGVTNHFDLALYQMWRTKDKREEVDTKYDGMKLRARYRFGEKGQYFLDPLFYAEYKRSAEHHDPHQLELKVILAKDIGNFNIAYNHILSQALESDGVTESEYALGIKYKVNNRFSAGLESKGSYLSDKYYFGPTFSFGFRKFWISAGLVSAMHKRADDLQVRVIAGMPF